MPADAVNHVISSSLNIPSIDLVSDVTKLEVENRSLKTPDSIVGSYSNADNKTLLIGHSSTVFHDLNRVMVGDIIQYDGIMFIVDNIELLPKKNIRMDDILADEDNNTLILMTCAGEDLGAGDATHRLILTAKAV